MSATAYARDQPHGFTNRIERVAIVGASGQLGQHMTQELLKTNKHTITAITRKGSGNEFPEGVQVAVVDYDDEASLVSALEGQQFLIITLAYAAGNETHHKIVQAAAKAKVPHIMPNLYSSDVVVANQALGDELGIGPIVRPLLTEIERVGFSAWTMLVTSFWFEFSLSRSAEWFGFEINKRQAIIFDDGKARVVTTTWTQCGRAVAALLSLKKMPEDENDTSPTLQQFRNKPLYVSSFNVNQREMLDSLLRVTKTTDADWDIKYESTAKRVEDGRAGVAKGDPKGFAKMFYSRIFSPNCPANYQHKVHNEVLGLPVEDFDGATAATVDLTKNGGAPTSGSPLDLKVEA